MMQSSEQIQYVTRNFSVLQGLKNVPLGLWFLLISAGNAGWLPWLAEGRLGGRGATFLLALGCYALLGFYYERYFGQVRPIATMRKKIQNLVLMLGLGASLAADWWLPLPVSLLALMIAAMFLVEYELANGRFRHYLLIMVLVFVVVGLLPLLSGLPLNDLWVGSMGIFFQFAMGSSLIITGILDHLFLTSVLDPIEEPYE
jgi:hypothetical protein